MDRPRSQQILFRLVPPLAVWALGKFLDTPNVKGALQEVDSHAFIQKRRALRSTRRFARNATQNRGWLAAGAAAIALGIGFIAKASSSHSRMK